MARPRRHELRGAAGIERAEAGHLGGGRLRGHRHHHVVALRQLFGHEERAGEELALAEALEAGEVFLGSALGRGFAEQRRDLLRVGEQQLARAQVQRVRARHLAAVRVGALDVEHAGAAGVRLHEGPLRGFAQRLLDRVGREGAEERHGRARVAALVGR